MDGYMGTPKTTVVGTGSEGLKCIKSNDQCFVFVKRIAAKLSSLQSEINYRLFVRHEEKLSQYSRP